jgi:gas vesicle protein
MSKNGGRFAAGLFGILAGVIGGLLLAPRSGKETRDELIAKIRDIFGIYSEEFRDKYNKIRKTVENKVIAIRKAGEEIDREKYGKVVDEVVGEFKSDLTATKDGVEKLSKYLKKDWEKMKKAIA